MLWQLETLNANFTTLSSVNFEAMQGIKGLAAAAHDILPRAAESEPARLLDGTKAPLKQTAAIPTPPPQVKLHFWVELWFELNGGMPLIHDALACTPWGRLPVNRQFCIAQVGG